MKWFNLNLQLSDDDKRDALREYHSLVYHLEGIFRVTRPHIYYENLKKLLTDIINKQNLPDFENDKTVINLQHSDNEILNLPWNISELNDEQIQTNNNLFLVNSFQPIKDDIFKGLPRPIRILVVFSAPENISRLAYEEEEETLLLAFEKSIELNQIEIDFTEDATLDTIKSYLNNKQYHILHYSGHSVFDKTKQQAFLALEDNFFNFKVVTAQKFSETIKGAKYKLPLVVLSSCQSAQATTADKDESQNYEQALNGLTTHLLATGIPAVVGMGMSVSDEYAAVFTTDFYKHLYKKKDLHAAFQKALKTTKTNEYKVTNQLPLQWIIPKLYVSQQINDIIDWHAEAEATPPRHISRFKNIIYEQDENFRFIGRRFEQKTALAELNKNITVIITGQGGLGKTTLAEKLIYRLALSYDIETFVFRHTDNLPQDIIKRIENFLSQNNPEQLKAVKEFFKDKETEAKDIFILKIRTFLKILRLSDKKIYFLFDNLETFLDLKTHSFTKEYNKLEEIIDLITQIFPVIITSRYPVPNKNWTEITLNTVSFSDYLQKIKQLEFYTIFNFLKYQESCAKAKKYDLTYEKIIKLIYEKTAGNYRVLEMLNRLMVDSFDFSFFQLALDNEKDFLQKILRVYDLKEKVSENMLFDNLYDLLSETQKNILQTLTGFNVPVKPLAIQMQTNLDIKVIETGLNYLKEASLCEKTATSQNSFILNNIIKQLLKDKIAIIEFSHQSAGEYFETENDFIQAFEHYFNANTFEKVKSLGSHLTNVFGEHQDFESSQYFALKTYDLIKEKADWDLLNKIGQNFHYLGMLEFSLNFFKKALNKSKQIGNKLREGRTLGNIGNNYSARSNYKIALKYLEESLKISREIGDKLGERITLGNMGNNYSARGDYKTALKYFEESLKISRVIGDKSGEGIIFNNIVSIYYAHGDYETALKYLEESLKIRREIDDKIGEGSTLNNIASIYKAQSDYKTALKYFEESLKIGREIGDKLGEGTTLHNIASIYYAHGDYETALKYFEESLKISREIGDKSGEGITFNNISQIYYAHGDYKTALKYLEESLKISREIGDKFGEDTILNNISQIYYVKGDYETALKYLEESLKISREIGDKLEEGRALNNISQIYDTHGDYKTALKYLEESLKIIREIGDKSVEGTTLGNIGNNYSARGDYKTALKYFEESLKIRREIGDKLGEGTTLHNIASIYYAHGDYETTLKYLEESLKISREIGDWKGAAISLSNIGISLLNQNQKQEGFAYLMESYKIYRQIGNTQLQNVLNNAFQQFGLTEEQLQQFLN